MASKGMKVATALHHLRLDKNATEEDVKLAYRELAKMWHPDRYRDNDPMKPEADRQIKVVNEAKSVALTYVKKHGHFRFVKDAGIEMPGRKAPRQPQPPPPRQEAPQQKPPRAKPQEPPRQRTYQAPPKQDPPKQASPKKESYQKKATPKPKPEPEPEPITTPELDDIFEDSTSFSDYLPSQTTLLGVIILAAVAFFMYTMISSLFNSPADRLKAYTEQAAIEEKIVRPAKKKVVVAKEDSVLAEIEEEIVEAEIDTFFTLGSTKEWVSYVQGSPLQIKGPLWRYGFSTITFAGDSVIGWVNSELNPMKSGIILDSGFVYPYSTYDMGSTIQEVVYLQGPPDVVVDTLWSYGEATVTFNKQGLVVAWFNDMQNRLFVQ